MTHPPSSNDLKMTDVPSFCKTSYTRERESNKDPVELKIVTRVPSKWRFVDLETGEVYRYGPCEKGMFTKITATQFSKEYRR